MRVYITSTPEELEGHQAVARDAAAEMGHEALLRDPARGRGLKPFLQEVPTTSTKWF